MPLPSPKGREKKDNFLKRCMANPTAIKDFPDTKQRFAVCNSQWDKAKKRKKVIDEYDTKIF